MSGMKRFWQGMLWGALAGGAVSLLDKDTRQAVKNNCQKAGKNIAYVLKNPGEITDQVKVKAIKLKTTVEEIGEDISFIASKVEELKETTPQVTKMLKETKASFTNTDGDQFEHEKDEQL